MDELREKVRKKFADGADLIKLFATASSRDGGKQTMSDAQIEAACAESKALGKRAAVHAHAAGGAKPAVLAGCTSIEHGTFLTDEVLDLMAQRGVYLDTNLSNVPNYINHKEAFLGLGIEKITLVEIRFAIPFHAQGIGQRAIGIVGEQVAEVRVEGARARASGHP